MKKQISYGVEIKADQEYFDFAPLAGQWHGPLAIQVSNLSQITRGPIKVVLQVPSHSETPLIILNPKANYNPAT